MDWVEDVMKKPYSAGCPLLSIITNSDNRFLDPFTYPTSTSLSDRPYMCACLCAYNDLTRKDKIEISSSPRNDYNLRVRSRAPIYDLRRYNHVCLWLVAHFILCFDTTMPP